MDLTRKVNQDDYTEKMPSYPALTLAAHVAIKGIQLGAVVGRISGSLINLVRGGTTESRVQRWAKYNTRGPIIGCAVSLAMLAGKAYGTKDLDVAGVDDR